MGNNIRDLDALHQVMRGDITLDKACEGMTDDFEIGHVSHRADGDWRKVAQGKWVPVKAAGGQQKKQGGAEGAKPAEQKGGPYKTPEEWDKIFGITGEPKTQSFKPRRSFWEDYKSRNGENKAKSYEVTEKGAREIKPEQKSGDIADTDIDGWDKTEFTTGNVWKSADGNARIDSIKTENGIKYQLKMNEGNRHMAYKGNFDSPEEAAAAAKGNEDWPEPDIKEPEPDDEPPYEYDNPAPAMNAEASEERAEDTPVAITGRKEGLSISDETSRDRFMQLITNHWSKKFNDPSKVQVYRTPKGNWDTYYNGHRLGIIGGENLDSELADELGWLERPMPDFADDAAPRLTRDTKIRLSRIKREQTQDERRTYKIGEISEKTGLQKTANGWREVKKGGAPTGGKAEVNPITGKPMRPETLAYAQQKKADAQAPAPKVSLKEHAEKMAMANPAIKAYSDQKKADAEAKRNTEKTAGGFTLAQNDKIKAAATDVIFKRRGEKLTPADLQREYKMSEPEANEAARRINEYFDNLEKDRQEFAKGGDKKAQSAKPQASPMAGEKSAAPAPGKKIFNTFLNEGDDGPNESMSNLFYSTPSGWEKKYPLAAKRVAEEEKNGHVGDPRKEIVQEILERGGGDPQKTADELNKSEVEVGNWKVLSDNDKFFEVQGAVKGRAGHGRTKKIRIYKQPLKPMWGKRIN